MVWGRLDRAEDLAQLSANLVKNGTEVVCKKAGSHVKSLSYQTLAVQFRTLLFQ